MATSRNAWPAEYSSQEPVIMPRPRAGADHPSARREPPIGRFVRPFTRFIEVETSGGVVLAFCTLVALLAANSPWGPQYAAFWEVPISLSIGDFTLEHTLREWINDALMTIFFFVVGLEIKREMIAGELRDPRKAALPIVAAAGGMVVPAAIYLMLQGGRPGESGWGIPMATDIAFVAGILALLGPRIPAGLKILLLTLAIVDDIGAVLVIALFYTDHVSATALVWAAAGFVGVFALNKVGVRQVSIYVAMGVGIWLAFLESGVHPTVAGVLLGLMTPGVAWIGDRALLESLSDAIEKLFGDDEAEAVETRRRKRLGGVSQAAREAVSPLSRLEHSLHHWVAMVVMPVFALANAGVRLDPTAFSQPVAWAIIAGLSLGKPLGIVLFSAAAVKLGLARLPAGVSWSLLSGAGCLAGVGFTMSLFIAGLALPDELSGAGKFGILAGSGASAVLGYVLLRRSASKERVER
jgi:Na+:H+ antiporter, NhaA family